MLDKNISPEKLKKLSERDLINLCAEIRRFLIKTVSRTGGHLASSLGTVELSVALHKVYSSPRDKFIFDVGHQAYTHKLLTGRLERFYTLRSEGGISGFPRRGESEHDAFIGGHSGISVSAALGIAEALRLTGDNSKVIAIAGDGSFTDGGIYEGLNNAGKSRANLLVILNDNEMCISKNTGAISTYLSHLRSTRKYYKAKIDMKSLLGKSRGGQAVSDAVSVTKKFVKNAIYKSNLFENLGFAYYGPVDGHNLKELTEVLELAKMIDRPCLIHVKTKKGKGYKPAEHNSGMYHGIVGQNSGSDQKTPKKETYSDVFGKEIARLGRADSRICLISAAMKYATGCNYFNDEFPDRFYDCGIAEAHAATFAAGLSTQGLLPVFAVYSTFSQRCFDRLIHDAAIEKAHIVLAIDRAGAVGEDGETHQGIFDAAMFGIIPNFTVFSPSNARELRECLNRALYQTDGPVAVRYPRGQLPASRTNADLPGGRNADFCLYKTEGGGSRLRVTYGRLTDMLLKNTAAANCDILQLVKIQPLGKDVVDTARAYSEIIFYEEGIKRGGIGELLAFELLTQGWGGTYEIRAFEDFVPAADTKTQLRKLSL